VSESSPGCGALGGPGVHRKEILDFADKAMYESKRLGKNRVTLWPFAAGEVRVTKPDGANETAGVLNLLRRLQSQPDGVCGLLNQRTERDLASV
jgi:hypothetical protein